MELSTIIITFLCLSAWDKMLKMGRPLKYRHLLERLEDETLYSAGTIAALSGSASSEERHNIVKSLSRLSRSHGFPNRGDGLIEIAGQAPVRAYRGKRWKTLIHDGDPNPSTHT